VALQALALYGVLHDERWLDRLKESYLSNHQQSEVRQTAYETLLVLADFGVRWPKLRKKETADASLMYLQKAEAFYKPTRAFYWVRKECHKFLKNKQEADKDRKRFQQTAATTAFDYYLPGHTAGWRGDLDEAVRSYEAALQIQPDHFNSLFFLAMRLSKLGRHDEAAQIYRACTVLRPDHVPTLRNRAALIAQQGNLEEASRLLAKAIQINPESAYSYEVRAFVYAHLKQNDKAQTDH
jgi:tetratricopeptide (TPR) repeat protein